MSSIKKEMRSREHVPDIHFSGVFSQLETSTTPEKTSRYGINDLYSKTQPCLTRSTPQHGRYPNASRWRCGKGEAMGQTRSEQHSKVIRPLFLFDKPRSP